MFRRVLELIGWSRHPDAVSVTRLPRAQLVLFGIVAAACIGVWSHIL